MTDTYECNDMVQSLHEVLNIGELEDGQPSMLDVTKLIVNEHDEADDHVGCSESSQTNEGFLADIGPWGMADAKEDRLGEMSSDAGDWDGIPTWSSFFLGRRAVEEDIVAMETNVVLSRWMYVE